MIEVSSFSGIPVGVLGLGKSGFVAAQALARGGAEVMAWDDDLKKRDAAAEAGVTIVDLRSADLAVMPSLVLSPGIPHSHPAPHPVMPI
jgi:UDP-N-acetylmuramoylalanine--D-glutamate ligase